MGEEEVAVVVEDPVQESAPEVPQEEIPEEIPEEGPAAKDKVKDEFAERERLKKEEEAKIIITPAVLPVKKEEESEEESEEEEEPEPVKKKLSLSALKPAVQIKMDIPAEEPPTRRRKAARDPSVDEGFLATTKPKVEEPVVPAVPEVEEESEEEDEPEPEPVKKKLSLSDLKPAVQIKMAIPADEPPTRRRKNVREPSVDEGFLANIPEVPKVAPPPVIEEESITVEEVAEVESTPGKDKVRDEFAERERLKKEEEAKIIITPAVLPAKKEEESEEESE